MEGKNLYIKEIWINASEHYGCGDSGVYETFTDKVGQLFRFLQKEHGRCISKVYIDGPNGEAIQVGWVFQKVRKYEDCAKTYLAETWVEVHEQPPTKTIENHFYRFNN